MTDKTHLEAFAGGLSAPLATELVAIFARGHRDPSLKPTDVVLKLREAMERHLTEGDHAAPRPDGP